MRKICSNCKGSGKEPETIYWNNQVVVYKGEPCQVWGCKNGYISDVKTKRVRLCENE